MGRQPHALVFLKNTLRLVNELTAEPYKKECQEKNLPFGSMPVDFLSRHSAQLPERALLL